MAWSNYLDFELLIERTAEEGYYNVRVLNSPAGQASHQFRLPFSQLELENFLLRVGRTRHGVRRLSSPEMEAVRQFGSTLFDTVFAQDVRVCYRSSLDSARAQRAGLRIRMRLTGAPELADLPWEYLYSADLDSFLVLSTETPLVRAFDLPHGVQPLLVKPPLRILTMISNPNNYDALDVEREWANLTGALDDLLKRGMVDLERTPDATLLSLQRSLRRGEYHIFHFVGHGGFDQQTQDGVLLLEDNRGEGRPTSSQYIGTLLRDHRPLRMAVLNACEGARASRSDPFGGTAQNLIRQGLPAVIAMQFEITDTAAITFAQEFYSAIADSYPVDAALAEARKAIFGVENDIEWGTPVLYMRAPDGQIFDVARISGTERQHMRIAALLSEARAAMAEGDWTEAAARLRAVLTIEPQHEEATTLMHQVQQHLGTAQESITDADNAPDGPATAGQQQQQSHAAAMLKAVRSRGGTWGDRRLSLGLIGTILGVIAIAMLLSALDGPFDGIIGQDATETATATATPAPSTATTTPGNTASDTPTPTIPDQAATETAEAQRVRRIIASLWPMVLREEFNNNNRDWQVDNFVSDRLGGTRQVTDGNYLWELFAGQDVFYWTLAPTNAVEDFYLTTSVQMLEQPDESYVGVVFRHNGEQFYHFVVDPGNQTYNIRYWDGSAWDILHDTTETTALQPEQQNQLAVLAQGSIYHMFINERYITSVEDARLSGGRTGVIVEFPSVGEATIAFDTFVLRTASGMTLQTATPEPTATMVAPPATPRPTATEQPTLAPTPTEQPTLAPTPTEQPTLAPTPTYTSTPTPTNTAAPTATPTITPTPFATAIINEDRSRLRTETRIVQETIIGVACAGDRALVFATAQTGELAWYRIRVTDITDEDCSSDSNEPRVTSGAEGWIAEFLLVLNPTPTVEGYPAP